MQRQTGGPFMVTEKAEKDKRISLRPGRYVRIESDTRLARVDEEYDLLRKFANFHFSSLTNADATIDDLNVDFMGIIESFGTGIGEAKRALKENGSPTLYYKTFDITDNITSVVIPVNEEYMEIKSNTKPGKKLGLRVKPGKLSKLLWIRIIHPVQNAD